MKYQAATQNAIREWKRNGRKDSFTADVMTGDQGNETVHAHIYHHETFPEGGQTFTVDLRTGKGSDILLERGRFAFNNGQETIL